MRVILDTNVWRLLVDTGAVTELRRLCRLKMLSVLMPPATAFEVARTPKMETRLALLAALCHGEWKRLMPEVYTESQEIIAEIRRCRPEWMLPKTDKHRFQPLFRDWKGKSGFWRRLKDHPEAFAKVLTEVGKVDLARARTLAYKRRASFRSKNLTMSNYLDKWMAEFPSPREGCDGDKVEAWRAEALEALNYALANRNNPYYEWMSCDIDFRRIKLSSRDWVRFWLYDCQRDRLPRQWLRYAVAFLQGFRKPSDGNPVDIQLAQYAPDCDLFVTGDTRFSWVLDECRKYSVCNLPEVWAPPTAHKDSAVAMVLQRIRERS